MTKAEKQEAAEQARERLTDLLPPGTTVYSITRHISSTGMSRSIDFIIIGQESREPWQITGLLADLLEVPRNPNHNGIRVKGCGYNHAGSVVEHVAQRLHGSPDALKQCRL